MRFLSEYRHTRRRIYLAPAAGRHACAQRAQCVTLPRRQRITRSLGGAALDRVRVYHETKPSRR
jgi:hypothetical protein